MDGSIPTVYADTETPSSSVLQHTQTAVAIPNTEELTMIPPRDWVPSPNNR